MRCSYATGNMQLCKREANYECFEQTPEDAKLMCYKSFLTCYQHALKFWERKDYCAKSKKYVLNDKYIGVRKCKPIKYIDPSFKNLFENRFVSFIRNTDLFYDST